MLNKLLKIYNELNDLYVEKRTHSVFVALVELRFQIKKLHDKQKKNGVDVFQTIIPPPPPPPDGDED